MKSIAVSLQTVLPRAAPNFFMSFAWCGQLKNLPDKPGDTAALGSWATALSGYLLQVPGHRIGDARVFTRAQLKTAHEVITLAMFLPFATVYRDQSFKLDYLWAGLCLVGAAYLIFRSR